MAKLTVINDPYVVMQAQQVVLEALANAVLDLDVAVPGGRTSDTVFDSCQAILVKRQSEIPTDIFRLSLQIWQYLRYQMTDEE